MGGRGRGQHLDGGSRPQRWALSRSRSPAVSEGSEGVRDKQQPWNEGVCCHGDAETLTTPKTQWLVE